MSNEDIRSENTRKPDDPLYRASDVPDGVSYDSEKEFFDRERWHDVESETASYSEANSDDLSHYSVTSITVLLLVIVLAGTSGIVAACIIHSLTDWMKTPEITPLNYQPTPIQWIGFTQDSVVDCEVEEPTCFAVANNGIFYIGEKKPASIKVFSENGKIIQTIGLDSPPMAIAVGEPDRLFAGKIIVALADAVTVYSADGEPEFSWKTPHENSEIRSLAIEKNAVYAADSGTKQIHQFGEKGELIRSFGYPAGSPTKNSNDEESTDVKVFPGFVVNIAPMTLTVSRKTGLIHVANPGKHRIETFTPDGRWEPSFSWGNSSNDLIGFAGHCNPIALDTFQGGEIITAEKTVARVKVFRTDRRLDCVVAGPELLDVPPKNIPRLESWTPVLLSSDRSVSIGVVHDTNIVVFDPTMRILRHFIPNKLLDAEMPGEQ